MASRKVNLGMPDLSKLTPKITIKNQANWLKLNLMSVSLPVAIQSGYDAGIYKISKKLISIVRRAVKSGAPPPGSGVIWPQLKQSTIDKWGPHGIYKLTGQYAHSIGLYKYKSRTLVGFPHGSRHLLNDGALTVNQIAIILEHGNKRIPARPLWRPALKSFGGNRKIREELMAQIRKSIINKTGLSPSQVRKLW